MVSALSPDEALLAVGDADGITKLWDLASGRLRARLKVCGAGAGLHVVWRVEGRMGSGAFLSCGTWALVVRVHGQEVGVGAGTAAGCVAAHRWARA